MTQVGAGRITPQTNGSTMLHTCEPVRRATKHMVDAIKLALIGRKLEHEGKEEVRLRYSYSADELRPASQRAAKTTADFRPVMLAEVLAVLRAQDASSEGARLSQHLALRPLCTSMDAP